MNDSSENMKLIFLFIKSKNARDESVIFKGKHVTEHARPEKCEVKADAYYIVIRHVSVAFVHYLTRRTNFSCMCISVLYMFRATMYP